MKWKNLAIDRAKDCFSADHANVQPHSGSQANMGVFSVLKPVIPFFYEPSMAVILLMAVQLFFRDAHNVVLWS